MNLGERDFIVLRFSDAIATPRTLLDVRIRRALAHATDRQSLADGLTEGLGSVADTLVLPQVEYFSDADRAVTKYAHDPRRAEQLLNEVGYARGGDGFFASASDGRFNPEIAVAQGGRNDGEVQIMVDGLRRGGIDASVRIIPRARKTDSAEVYVGEEYIGVVFFDEKDARSSYFELPILALDLDEPGLLKN